VYFSLTDGLFLLDKVVRMGGMFLFTIFNCVVMTRKVIWSLVVLSYFNMYSRYCYELFMASPSSFIY
jgi:hypothetical protein